MQEAEIKKTLHWLWLLPIFAMLIALYLAYKSISNLGPEITIELASANGLEVGRTKIRYRSLEVGTVKEITLTPDFQRVIIHAQMKKMAEPLLKADSEFWVVSPQIGITGIKGFNTLLSGNFIMISPGKSSTYSNKFKGLDESPLIPNSIPGIRVFLEAETNSGLNVGSAVYYKGFRVGRIDYLNFNQDFSKIEAQAFIFAPYDKLINSKTKFYNSSGIDVKLGNRGLELNMPALETVLMGGLSFSSEKSNETFLAANTVFKVYSSVQDFAEKPSYQKVNYALRFEQSVKGLRKGSLVEFQGIELGNVSDIQLIYDEKKKLALVLVLLELEYERLKPSANSIVNKNSLTDLIENGLYATLETANLVSGEKLIRLNMNPGEEKQIIAIDEYSKYPLIPSQASGFDLIMNQSNEILTKIKNLQLEELINSANSAVLSLEKVVKDLEGSGKNLNKTLITINKAANSAEKMLNNFNKEIPSLSKQVKHTMQSLDSESNFYFKLNRTLEDLSKMAQSINRVMRQLDAKPNSMIFGK